MGVRVEAVRSNCRKGRTQAGQDIIAVLIPSSPSPWVVLVCELDPLTSTRCLRVAPSSHAKVAAQGLPQGFKAGYGGSEVQRGKGGGTTWGVVDGEEGEEGMDQGVGQRVRPALWARVHGGVE